MVTIVEDSVGAHDIVSHPCDKGRYELDFHVFGHPSCTENLVGALREIGLEDWWLPDPFNVFMNTVFLEDGRYFTEAAISRAGDSDCHCGPRWTSLAPSPPALRISTPPTGTGSRTSR